MSKLLVSHGGLLGMHITPPSLRTNIRVHFSNILVSQTLKLHNFFSIGPFSKIFCLGKRGHVALSIPHEIFCHKRLYSVASA